MLDLVLENGNLITMNNDNDNKDLQGLVKADKGEKKKVIRTYSSNKNMPKNNKKTILKVDLDLSLTAQVINLIRLQNNLMSCVN